MSEFDPANYNKLDSHLTSILGLLVFELVVHGDNRGWFKENYNASDLIKHGLPEDFDPVQNNISFNKRRGVTRGIHAEPWNKYISIARGSVFAAIVDFRSGDKFGRVETFELNPGLAIYVPRGCGNSFQTLEDDTVYTYLVDEHWYYEAQYTLVNLADPDLAIAWPISLEDAEISEKDRSHPYLSETIPVEA